MNVLIVVCLLIIFSAIFFFVGLFVGSDIDDLLDRSEVDEKDILVSQYHHMINECRNANKGISRLKKKNQGLLARVNSAKSIMEVVSHSDTRFTTAARLFLGHCPKCNNTGRYVDEGHLDVICDHCKVGENLNTEATNDRPALKQAVGISEN